MPKVSICIPAYKHPNFLIRAIDSVLLQSYTDYEIIVTDDSPNNELGTIIKDKYSHVKNLYYFKNIHRLGSTANWNYAISLANSEIIKLLHHDDWFTNEDSLKELLTPLLTDPQIEFVCCQSHLYRENKRVRTQKPSKDLINLFNRDIHIILFKNFIAPSSTLFRKKEIVFDTKLAWLVDADFYARYITDKNFHYIAKPLVSLNISQGRLTSECEDNLNLLLSEIIYLYFKYESITLAKQNILKYFRIIIRNFRLYEAKTILAQSGISEMPLEMENFINRLSWMDRIQDSVFIILRHAKRAVAGRN